MSLAHWPQDWVVTMTQNLSVGFVTVLRYMIPEWKNLAILLRKNWWPHRFTYCVQKLQSGRWEMALRRRCLPDKKFVFSGPFWPPLTEVAQSFSGKRRIWVPPIMQITTLMSIIVYRSHRYVEFHTDRFRITGVIHEKPIWDDHNTFLFIQISNSVLVRKAVISTDIWTCPPTLVVGNYEYRIPIPHFT